jgi:hypothetical protein
MPMATSTTDEGPSDRAKETVSLSATGAPTSEDGGKTIPPRLTKAEIRERLCLASSGLVEEIHALALRQNTAEDQRETRLGLDGKAQGLMATAGLSLTVAFTFGGLLLQSPKYIEPLGLWLGRAVLGLYAIALLLGLLASIWAVRALFVRDGYRAVTDDDVFNKAMLESVDREAHADSDKAKRLYRRFITVQHWTVYRHHFDVHERKAELIKRGQWFFVGFLVSLLLIGGALTYSAFVGFDKTLDEIAQKAQTQSPPTQAVKP